MPLMVFESLVCNYPIIVLFLTEGYFVLELLNLPHTMTCYVYVPVIIHCSHKEAYLMKATMQYPPANISLSFLRLLEKWHNIQQPLPVQVQLGRGYKITSTAAARCKSSACRKPIFPSSGKQSIWMLFAGLLENCSTYYLACTYTARIYMYLHFI